MFGYRIDRLEPFSLPLRSPLETAHGTIDSRDGFLLAVRDERGDPRGVGEATPLPGWTESHEGCRRALDRTQRVLIDSETGAAIGIPEDPGATDQEAVERSIDPDSTPAAAHAIESAVLDHRARESDRRMADLLREHSPWGGTAPSTVPVNATIGGGTLDATREAAIGAVEAGYGCLKLKAGADELQADLDRIRTVREAIGEEAAIRIDANAAWDRQTAERAVDELAALDVEYLEQPLPVDDLEGHARLRSKGVPIALDESLRGFSIDAIAKSGAADLVVCKPMVLGGPARTVAVAAEARAEGLDPVVTTTIDGAVARIAATHAAAAIPDVKPCGLATGALLADDLIDDPPSVSRGELPVADPPSFRLL